MDISWHFTLRGPEPDVYAVRAGYNMSIVSECGEMDDVAVRFDFPWWFHQSRRDYLGD